MRILPTLLALLAAFEISPVAREYHVSPTGDDQGAGSSAEPLRTIAAAARLARAGDVVTVHAGLYRERIDPPRGGTSDSERILYRAAPGERVVVKGSEVVKGWEELEGDTWRVALPNEFFGAFNPYADLIHGDWFFDKGRPHHTGAVYVGGHWLTEAATREEVLRPAGDKPLWFGEVDATQTVIQAQFPGVDPNEAEVEINVRQTVFYPSRPGINYLTVRGFILRHAATPWAPPTAEQIGIIGTHWSRGWIIEDNDIQYSTCVGVTLGKHGDEFDNRSESTSEGYVRTIERAHAFAIPWTGEGVGHHLVRRNLIAHCEQAGIVGSLGAIFSTITGNTIHDIHVRQLFSGAEMAGIKLHGAIDTVISRNHIHHCVQGIWLDWMSQGTRVTGNLLHDNNDWRDIFLEVNHGPFLVDNNILLSSHTVFDQSEGGAYVHNLFAGQLRMGTELNRQTPYHPAHSTRVAGLTTTQGGDNRFLNNIVVGRKGLVVYDTAAMPVRMEGNVLLHRADPGKAEAAPLVLTEFDPDIRLSEEADGVYLQITLDQGWAEQRSRALVTTERLGIARTPGLPFVQPDGAPYRLDQDYFGRMRDTENPFPGPFEITSGGRLSLKVWPID